MRLYVYTVVLVGSLYAIATVASASSGPALPDDNSPLVISIASADTSPAASPD